MILPLKECPAAAAQGALAIECRSQDQDVRNALAPLHHPMTAENVARERQLLEEWGGGCHQRFGATAYQEKSLGSLLYIRGVKPNNEFVEELQWDSPKSTFEGTADRISWDGSKWRSMGQTDFLDHPSLSGSHVESGSDSIFVAHSRAVDAVVLDQLKEKRVWTSGVPSWFRLAEKGIWVEGCSEGLGFESTLPTLQEAVLQLPEIKKWTVLTHEAAVNEWAQQSIPAIATYRVNLNYGIAAKQAVKKSTHLFWSSGSQFDELKEGINPDAQHACGPGKTAQHLRAAGLNPVVFPSVEEWRKWLKIQD
jgi:hydroxymethylbilane synthase